ncbi:Glycosyltransferase involved in cell wall bisynthesis [Gammaproteobacteria bacterium]
MTPPLRLLHVVESFSTGTLQAVRTLCQMLNGAAVCHVLHGCRDEGDGARPEGFPTTVSFLPWSVGREISPRQDYQALQQLREIVLRLNPDLIHAHSSKAGALVRLAFPTGGRRIVYSPHSYAFLRRDVSGLVRNFYWLVEWLLGRLPHITVACGLAEYGLAHQVSRRVVLIPNVVDLPAFTRNISIEKGGLCIGTLGGIRPQKNFPLFCAIAAACEDSGMRFCWIGGGTIPPDLTLPNNLTVTGWLDHASALNRLSACDVYLQTSQWEGLSLAVLEGMALGLPILATPAPGNVELVIEGYNGYLCDTAADFVTRLQALAADRSTVESLGAASRRLTEQSFTTEQMAPRWNSLYHHYSRYQCYG